MQPILVRKPRKSRRSAFSALLGLVMLSTIAAAVLVWYGLPVLQARFPVVQKAIDTVRRQVQPSDPKMGNLTPQRKTLVDQIERVKDEFGARVAATQARLAATQQRARESSTAVVARVQLQVDHGIESLRARLQKLELGARQNDASETQVAALQQELKQVTSEMERRVAALNEELDRVRWKVDETGNRNERAIAVLRDGEQRNRDALANKFAVERVDFEVSPNQSRELVPGISLRVTSTDVTYRRVNGWMRVKPGQRTIWLNGQGAQEPVIFYGDKDGLKRELVITNVTREKVAGYLLLPKQTQGAAEQPGEY